MDKQRWIVLYLLVALLGACSASLPPVADQTAPPSAAPTVVAPVAESQSNTLGSTFRTEKKDEELFLQALQHITGPFNQESSATARQTLESLLSDYPQSKWSASAQTILRLIGELDANRERLASEQDMGQKLAADRNRTRQENEQFKKEQRLVREKYETELAELQQANEQLKKDLQLLKNLEIQLDRREKMLR